MDNTHAPVSRVLRSKEQAKTSYDRMSRIYDLFSGGSEKGFVDQGLRKINLQSGEICLEIGFGTGHALVDLAKSAGEAGKVYGLDISEGMLKIAQKTLSTAGLSDRVALRLGDAVSLPYEENFFDAIFMSFTLELFDTPEIPIVLQGCKKVLKPGGRLCVVAMAQVENPGLAIRIYEWAHAHFPAYVDCRPIFAAEVLHIAGFTVMDVSRSSMWGLPVEIVLARKPD